MDYRDDESKHLMRIIRGNLILRFREHPEFDDMLGVAFARLATLLDKKPPPGISRNTYLVRQACWAGIKHLYSKESSLSPVNSRRSGYKGPPITLVPLEDSVEELQESDFVPELLSRMEAQKIWSSLRGQLTIKQLEVIEETLFKGREIHEYARESGKNYHTLFSTFQTALDRYRREIGLPLRNISGDPERKRVYQRAWRQANPEKRSAAREYARQWRVRRKIIAEGSPSRGQ